MGGALGEGVRADLAKTGIDVSTVFPGFIRSEINEKVKKVPFIVDTETGCRALAAAIEKEPGEGVRPDVAVDTDRLRDEGATAVRRRQIRVMGTNIRSIRVMVPITA